MSARAVNDHGYEAYLREGKLMGCRCRSCQALFVPPRTICTSCHSTDMAWEAVSGGGRLAAFTAIAIGPAFMAEEGYGRDNPYVTGVVELDEGPRVVARIEGVDASAPESIAVGASLRALFLHRGTEEAPRTFLAFEPA